MTKVQLSSGSGKVSAVLALITAAALIYLMVHDDVMTWLSGAAALGIAHGLVVLRGKQALLDRPPTGHT